MSRAPMNRDATTRLSDDRESAAAPPLVDDHDPYNTADSWRMKKLALAPKSRSTQSTVRQRPKR